MYPSNFYTLVLDKLHYHFVAICSMAVRSALRFDCFCSGQMFHTLTHFQSVPFGVRRAVESDVDGLLELQNDCQCSVQV